MATNVPGDGADVDVNNITVLAPAPCMEICLPGPKFGLKVQQKYVDGVTVWCEYGTDTVVTLSDEERLSLRPCAPKPPAPTETFDAECVDTDLVLITIAADGTTTQAVVGECPEAEQNEDLEVIAQCRADGFVWVVAYDPATLTESPTTTTRT